MRSTSEPILWKRAVSVFKKSVNVDVIGHEKVFFLQDHLEISSIVKTHRFFAMS